MITTVNVVQFQSKIKCCRAGKEINTTLTAMVREFLTSVAARDVQVKKEAVRKLHQSFKTISRDMGQRKWSKEDLHER